MRISESRPVIQMAGRYLNFDKFIEDPRGCTRGLIKRMLGRPSRAVERKLFGSVADIETLSVYDILLRVNSDTAELPWTLDAVVNHLCGLVDTLRRPAVVAARLELLELDDTVEEVADELLELAKREPAAARAALDGRIGRAIDLLLASSRDAYSSSIQVRDLLAQLSRFWLANDLRLTHHYILRRAAAPFGDPVLDGEGRKMTRQYAFLRLTLPIVRRTLKMYLQASDDHVHRGVWVLLLRPFKKAGERLQRRWSDRYGDAGLNVRLRTAVGAACHMLDELEDELNRFAQAKNARGASKLHQKPELRDDFDANLLLYLTSLVAVAWSRPGFDKEGQATGRAPIDDALYTRSRAPTDKAVRTPRSNRNHRDAARRLVALARWADGIDKPALPYSLRTLIVNGVVHKVTNQFEVSKLRGSPYTINALAYAIVNDLQALDCNVRKGAAELLDPDSFKTPGQIWMIDFAEGSLAWRINSQ